jgi:hypothetical protein
MPNILCNVPGCRRRSYQSVKGSACRACIVFWSLNHGFAEVVEVVVKQNSRTTYRTATPVAVDTSSWTADTMYTNNTPLQMYQIRSNPASEWQTVPVSDRPEDLNSDNVRVLLVYSKASSGTTNILPPQIVSTASGISLEQATEQIVNTQTSTKQTKASLKERKDRGESTKPRVWTPKYQNDHALCTVPGCKNGACNDVPGLKCVPHILDRIVEVSVQTGYVEFTIQAKKDFMFDNVEEGMYHTLVFKEIQLKIGGFHYDGKRYAYSEDMFFLAANACSPQEVETDKYILRTPLSSLDEFNERKDQFMSNLEHRKEKRDRRKEKQEE